MQSLFTQLMFATNDRRISLSVRQFYHKFGVTLFSGDFAVLKMEIAYVRLFGFEQYLSNNLSINICL